VEAAVAANDKAVEALQELLGGIQEARDETRGLITWLRVRPHRERQPLGFCRALVSSQT
jgi:hypothetical protein